MKMQKYLEAPLIQLVNQHEQEITSIINSRQAFHIVEIVVFGFLTLIIFVTVWMQSLSKLMERLKTTRTILGFIPVRVFVHNSKLTKEYETYIGELIN
jgi:hypothetical protein